MYRNRFFPLHGSCLFIAFCNHRTLEHQLCFFVSPFLSDIVWSYITPTLPLQHFARKWYCSPRDTWLKGIPLATFFFLLFSVPPCVRLLFSGNILCAKTLCLKESQLYLSSYFARVGLTRRRLQNKRKRTKEKKNTTLISRKRSFSALCICTSLCSLLSRRTTDIDDLCGGWLVPLLPLYWSHWLPGGANVTRNHHFAPQDFCLSVRITLSLSLSLSLRRLH